MDICRSNRVMEKSFPWNSSFEPGRNRRAAGVLLSRVELASIYGVSGSSLDVTKSTNFGSLEPVHPRSLLGCAAGEFTAIYFWVPPAFGMKI
jgi:hypothetical protein